MAGDAAPCSPGENHPRAGELAAVIDVCKGRVSEAATDALHRHADLLYPILVELDVEVGVVKTKIYDAKLALSAIARDALNAGAVDGFASFGLAADGRTVADASLLRELLFTMMALHRPPAERYRSATHGREVRALLEKVRRLTPHASVLYLVDTGADPNEDDMAALMVQLNWTLLATGQLEL
jgi:hypothetical protein